MQKKKIGLIVSDPNEWSIQSHYPGPTIAMQNCPPQEIFCYNVEKEDRLMSSMVFYKHDDGIYIASDSLNVRYDEAGKEVGRKYIQKIFPIKESLVGVIGVTTLRENNKIVEISDVMKNINPCNERENFTKYLQKLLINSQDINANLPILDNIEVMIASKERGDGFTITPSYVHKHPLSLHQFQIWGDFQDFPPNYDTLISKIGVANTLKAIINNAADINGHKTIDGPVQIWKIGKKIEDLSKISF